MSFIDKIRGHRRYLVLPAALLWACSSAGSDGSPTDLGDEPGAEGVSVETQSLFANQNKYWCALGSDGAACTDNGSPHGAQPTINVCWESSTYDDSTLASMRAYVQDGMRRNYNRHSRLNFVGWGRCASHQSGIHLFMNTECGGCNGYPSCNKLGKEFDGLDLGQRLPDCKPGHCGVVAGQEEMCQKYVALHEIGHGLGFWHENERADAPAGCKQCTGTGPCQSPGTAYGAFNCNIDYWPLGTTCSKMLSVSGTCPDPTPDSLKKELNPGDIAAVQRIYGRKFIGSLVTSTGRCAKSGGATQGEVVKIYECDESSPWLYDAPSKHLVRGEYCLAGGATSGSNVTIEMCTGTGAQWSFKNVQIRGWGGMCLDLAGGNTNGGLAQLWICTGGSNQLWTLTAAQEIRFGNSGSCLTAPTSGSGQLFVTSCNGSTSQKFTFGDGYESIYTLASGTKMCLDAQSPFDVDYLNGVGIPSNGQRVQVFTCIPRQFNQKWNLSGSLQNGYGLCLDRGVVEGNGVSLKASTCTGVDAQVWDYHTFL